MSALACGVDFGTTNSVVSLADREGTVQVLDVSPDRGATEPTTTMPSCIFLSKTGLEEAGEAALDLHFTNIAAGRLVFGLKAFLSDPSNTTTRVMRRDYTLSDLVAVALRSLKTVADKVAGEPVTRAVVGYPVVYQGAEGPEFRTRQQLALDRTHKAARLAGFDEVRLLSEAEAAGDMIDLDGASGRVLALDFGGGTFDAAVIDHSATSRRVLATNGAVVGGEAIDAEIFKGIVAPHLGMDAALAARPRVLSAMWYNNICSRQRLMSLRDDRESRLDVTRVRRDISQGSELVGLEGLADLESLLEQNGLLDLYRSVAAAKAELATAQTAMIDYRVFGTVTRKIPFTRSQLDSLVAPFMDHIDRCIASTLKDAGCASGDIDAVVLTGGSAQLGAFHDLIESRFHSAGIAEPDAFAAVAAGLGFRSLQEWSG